MNEEVGSRCEEVAPSSGGGEKMKRVHNPAPKARLLCPGRRYGTRHSASPRRKAWDGSVEISGAPRARHVGVAIGNVPLKSGRLQSAVGQSAPFALIAIVIAKEFAVRFCLRN